VASHFEPILMRDLIGVIYRFDS